MAVLQIALDFVQSDKAMQVAKRAAKYVDWIEAGTPLIKSCGIGVVRMLKEAFPDKKVVADMKIMDTGELEVGIAAKAGADIVSVMAAADLRTVAAAVKAGETFGVEILVDTLGASTERFKEVEALSPSYLCVHAGIDQQMAGVSVLEALQVLKTRIPLAVAGGLNKDNVGLAVKSGAQVIIVGGAITKAADPEKAAREIKEAIDKAVASLPR
jgi:3-hexulose-6-phosphate synthase/6-phospho-3-hexuloisomerase